MQLIWMSLVLSGVIAGSLGMYVWAPLGWLFYPLFPAFFMTLRYLLREVQQ